MDRSRNHPPQHRLSDLIEALIRLDKEDTERRYVARFDNLARGHVAKPSCCLIGAINEQLLQVCHAPGTEVGRCASQFLGNLADAVGP